MFSFDICVTCQLSIFKKIFKKKFLFILLILLILVLLINYREDKKIKDKNNSNHELCLIIPFRNRFNQLIKFLPHIDDFLNKQNIKHNILIINQVDNYRFNRASLINVGFKLSENFNCDYVGIHDVDLLPIEKRLKYYYPGDYVMHLSAPGLHPKYNYPSFLGGALLISKKNFYKVNGMSNKYWGWGMEDDEFYKRITNNKIEIKHPKLTQNDKTNTFIHLHSLSDKRDKMKLFNQKQMNRKVDHETGLQNLKFDLTESKKIEIDDSKGYLYNVKLKCDLELTPWCEFPKKEKV